MLIFVLPSEVFSVLPLPAVSVEDSPDVLLVSVVPESLPHAAREPAAIADASITARILLVLFFIFVTLLE